jgi:uncharacterized membrane protein
MKKALLVGIGFLGVFFCIPSISHAEKINDFSAVITVQKNAELRVVEKIQYDFEGADRHGIFRSIATNNSDGSEIGIKNITVTNERGIEYSFIKQYSSAGVTLRIGDKYKTVSGIKTYVISYEVSNALVSFDAYNELYWNITGNGWNIPIDKVTAQVVFENNENSVVQASCYKGVSGSTASCLIDENHIARVSNLLSNEGVTLAIGFDKNYANPISRIGGQIATAAGPVSPYVTLVKIASAIVGALVLGTALFLWYKEQDPKTTRPIVAWYEPSQQLDPVVLGTLIDKVTDLRDVVAQIISLAERGYISVTRTEEKRLAIFTTTDYVLTVVSSSNTIQSAIDKSVLRLVFGAEQPEIGFAVHMSDLSKRSSDVQSIIKSIRSLAANELLTKGYFEPQKNKGLGIVVQLFSAVTVYAGIKLGSLVTSFAYILIPTGLLSIFFLIAPGNKRTQSGVDTTQEVLGFKTFLSVTDKERFEFHNAPEKNPTQFMQFLPYAIAFGVEEKWAHQFEGVMIPKPDWYSGGATGVFIAADFARDLHSFGTGFSTIATPARSGSGGGGSSGGGSGGGGGGSW